MPQTPCDKFVYDFPYGFWGIVGGYGLRRMRWHCLWALQDFFYRPTGAGRSKSVQRLRGDCTEIVQSQCNYRAVSTRKSYWACAASVQRLRGDGAVTVQPPCLFWACGLRAVPVRGLCSATYDLATTCLRATNLQFFKFVYNFPLNKIVEAAEPVNPYDNLTAASCLRTEASWRPHGKGDTGSVDPWQAKCEWGISLGTCVVQCRMLHLPVFFFFLCVGLLYRAVCF